MDPLRRFEAQRARLVGLAYRMLGGRADAEDVAQEAWLRWSESDHAAIQNDEAFLTTIVSRLCLDRIKHEDVRRKAYRGLWLPDPVADGTALAAGGASELADDLSFALLLTLQRLSALERAVFILHDIFDRPFDEVAATLGRTETAVRQLASRARRAVREDSPRQSVSPDVYRRLLQEFMTALQDGDAQQLSDILAKDAVSMTDSGGHTPSAPVPIRGADRIIRLFLHLRQQGKDPQEGEALFTDINGLPGVVLLQGGVPRLTLSIAVNEGRISAIYVVLNPHKLTHITARIGGS